MASSLKNKLHAHGCASCHARLEDACSTLTIDPVCTTCRTGKPPAVWEENRLPHGCCHEHFRPVRPEERATYRLVGLRAWFICTTCKRTFPYRPERTAGG